MNVKKYHFVFFFDWFTFCRRLLTRSPCSLSTTAFLCSLSCSVISTSSEQFPCASRTSAARWIKWTPCRYVPTRPPTLVTWTFTSLKSIWSMLPCGWLCGHPTLWWSSTALWDNGTWSLHWSPRWHFWPLDVLPSSTPSFTLSLIPNTDW